MRRSWDQYLSHVGGASALALGLSLANLVGFFDCILSVVVGFLHRIFERIRTTLMPEKPPVAIQNSPTVIINEAVLQDLRRLEF